MSSPKLRLGLTLVGQPLGCTVQSVSDDAVFVGPALKPNDIILRINGADATKFQSIFSQGDASTPYKLSFQSAGKSMTTVIYKQVVADALPPQQNFSRTSSAGAHQPPPQHQPASGRTSGTSSHVPPYPSSQTGTSTAHVSSASHLLDMQALADAVYVPPLAPGQLPVVQMRVPGSSSAVHAPAYSNVADPSRHMPGTAAAMQQQHYQQYQPPPPPQQYHPPPPQQQPPPPQQYHPLPQQQHQFQQPAHQGSRSAGGVGQTSPQRAHPVHHHHHHQQQQQQQHQPHHQPHQQQHQAPTSKSSTPCPYFAKGACKFGANCMNSHAGVGAVSSAAPATSTSLFGQIYSGAASFASGVVGAAGTFLGLGGGSDSDDDGAAAANKSNPSYYSGAGLLLWDAHSKTVILGKDFNQEWSDFGGKRDQTDHDAWFTASREAAEESLGVLNGSIVNKQRVIAEVRAGTYVCYLIDTTGTKICKQFNDLAKAAGARRKRIEVSQMLRFPIADLVSVSLSQHTYCKDIFGTAHPIRSRILRAVRLFYDQGLFR